MTGNFEVVTLCRWYLMPNSSHLKLKSPMFIVALFTGATARAFHYKGVECAVKHCQKWVLCFRGYDRQVFSMVSYKYDFPKVVQKKLWRYFPINQSGNTAEQMACVNTATLHCPGKVKESFRPNSGALRCLTQQSGSAKPGHCTHLSRASHPSSQSIRCRPTVILFVQINNEKAAAPHGGTQRVVIAAFQAGSDGLCGRLAQLHCDLVCVCNFPQA